MQLNRFLFFIIFFFIVKVCIAAYELSGGNTKYSNYDGNLLIAYSGNAMIIEYSKSVDDAHSLSYPTHHFAWTSPTLMPNLRKYEGNVNKDIEIIRERVKAELMEPSIDENEIKNLMNTIQNEGSWPEINYEDVSRTGFEHHRHLENMVKLSRAYKKPESKFYGDPQLKEIIDASLNFWLRHDFISENWWWNQIGTPDYMISILLIMDEELTETQKTKAAPIVGRANLDAWGARPGGDLIKIAGILGKYGLFKRDTDIVEEVVKAMASEIAFAISRNTPDDVRGLQPDFSFHHRQDQVTSTLSYGLGYANAFAEWAAKVAGTKYNFPDKAIQLLVDFYLDGISKTMVYGKYPDPGAKNRSITRKGTLEPYDIEIPQKLLQATDYRREDLEEIIQIREGAIKPDLTFNKFFWHSEYLSHQRPDYFTSVRMYSSRNHNMEEPYNGEGLKNHHLADGSNFISRTGEEYLDIFPVWDWQKIPGTTVVQKPSLPSEDEIQKKGLTDFVGAVTDSVYGAACFNFKSVHDSLEARKAWFLFDEEYVCLGSGIQSTEDYRVATTLNQCYLKEDVVARKGNRKSTIKRGDHHLKKVSWILHDEVAYLFPSPTDVHLKNQEATGSWYSINRQSDSPKEEISKEVFTLWLDHGRKPQEGSYEYIVVPGMDESDIEGYRKDSNIKILANSPQIQAVKHTGLGISQIVFYQAGEILVSEDVKITIDTPGLVMIHADGPVIKKITVADPSRELDFIHLKVTAQVNANGNNIKAMWNEENGYSDIIINLPQEEYAGKSTIIETNFP